MTNLPKPENGKNGKMNGNTFMRNLLAGVSLIVILGGIVWNLAVTSNNVEHNEAAIKEVQKQLKDIPEMQGDIREMKVYLKLLLKDQGIKIPEDVEGKGG